MATVVARLVLCAAVAAVRVAAQGESDLWPMFMRTNMHDASVLDYGRNASSSGVRRVKASHDWVYNASHVVSSSPTLMPDVVIVGTGCGGGTCSGGDVVAVKRDTGELAWSTPMGLGVRYSSPMPSTDRSTVYIGTVSGNVVALSVADGKVLSTFKTGAEVSSTAVVASDRSIFIGSHDHFLYKLDASLNLVWKFETGDEVWSSPTLSSAGDKVFVGSVDKTVYALDSSTGALLWYHNTTGRIKASPLFADNKVLIGNYEDKSMFVLDADTGKELWRFTASDFLFSSPVIGGRNLIVLTGTDSYIYGIDRLTHKETFRVKTGSYIDSSPAVADGLAVVGSFDGVFYGVEVPSGQVAFRINVGSGIESSAAIGADGIYFGSSDGGVHKIVLNHY